MPEEKKMPISQASSLFLNWRFWVWILSILIVIFIWILFLKRRPSPPPITPTTPEPDLPNFEEEVKPPPKIDPEKLPPEERKRLEEWTKKVEEELKKELDKGILTPLPPPPPPPSLPSLP